MSKSALRLAAGLMGLAPALFAFSAYCASPLQTSWEVSTEFNDANSNGPVWVYCSKTAYLALPCTPLGAASTPSSPTMAGFQFSSSQTLPLVSHNVSMTPQSISAPPDIVSARALAMHPGTSGEFAVVRFTAPYSAKFKVSGQFYGIDGNGTATHTKVYLVVNTGAGTSTAVFTGTINVVPGSPPGSSAASFTSTVVALRTGETLDFEVGAGPNNNFNYGTTGLNAVIER